MTDILKDANDHTTYSPTVVSPQVPDPQAPGGVAVGDLAVSPEAVKELPVRMARRPEFGDSRLGAFGILGLGPLGSVFVCCSRLGA